MKAASKLVFFCFLLMGKSSLFAQQFHFGSTPFKLDKTANISSLKIVDDSEVFHISQQWKSEEMDFHLEQLPIFCRMEELVFKGSGINLRINLGTNDQVRKLEGKP